MKNLTFFGADASAPDNTQALQAAFNFGGDILIDGVFKIASTCTATRPVRLVGEKTKSALLATSSFADNVPMIHVCPDMAYGADGYEFRNIQFAPATQGVKACSIFFNTTAQGKFLRGTVIDGLIISQMADQSITSANANADGLIAPRITNNVLMGGLFLQNVGDSVVIEDNIISGEGIGVYATFVSGAANAVLSKNNITSRGGAIYLVGGIANGLEYNNVESVIYGYNGGVNALVFLQNAISASLVGNNVNSGNTADCIRTIGCRRTYIDRGHLQVSGTDKKHIRRESDYGSIIGQMNTYIDLALGAEVAGYIC